MTRLLLALSLLIGLAPFIAPAPITPASSDADSLVGLWQAKRWFGPFARGPLVVRRSGSTWTASMIGLDVPVRAERGELSFGLPEGQGAFRGRLADGGELRGHWFPSRPLGMGGHATPVRLMPAGTDRWSGDVVPFEDVFTFHLLVEKRPDGSLRALLRNPERDWGALFRVERIELDGKAVSLIGTRPGAREPGPVFTGAWDPESEVITLGFPGRGGSYDFRRAGDASDFYARGRRPARYTYRPPPARDDGWATGTLEDAGIDRVAMERLVQQFIDAPVDSFGSKVHAILVARHGRLVLEEYFHGEHRDKLHETRSASKSMTAVLVGAAMQAGVPLALSSPVYQTMNGGSFPAGLDERKRAMTLEHLLTMSPGFFCDDTNPDAPGNEERMQEQQEPDFYRYMLGVPLASPPGEKAVYCSGVSNLALGMVGRAAGESPLTLFDRLVAEPMGIQRYGWGTDPAQNPYGGGGAQFLPRDFMKFGQLMLNGGTWNGRRILSREFVARATSGLYHLRGREYGYQWWSLDYPYKDRTVRAFYAGGSGGQAVIVMPELDLVVCTMGANYFSSPGTFFVQMVVTPRDLLPAVREPGDDRSAPVGPRQDYAPRMHPRDLSGPIARR